MSAEELIDLGFPEKCNPLWLSNRYFPSRIGGRPAWLELEILPTKEQLQCPKCNGPMSFLCQLYAPFDSEHNFHRSIYVFICRLNECQANNDSTTITVLRSQLPKKNKFYSEVAPEDDGDPLPSIPALKTLCLVCGCAGPMICSRCMKASYCSVSHQLAHWPMHKQVCGTETDESSTSEFFFKNILFPECEIVMESASKNDDVKGEGSANEEAQEQARLAEFQKLAAEGKTGALQDIPDAELDRYVAGAGAVEDTYFERFKKATKDEPGQIVRYNRGGKPLWIADINDTVANQLKEIPVCTKCGGARQFEFQIMPQMLTILQDNHLDWGVLAVYTCAISCAIEGYVPEFVVKQDIMPTKN